MPSRNTRTKATFTLPVSGSIHADKQPRTRLLLVAPARASGSQRFKEGAVPGALLGVRFGDCCRGGVEAVFAMQYSLSPGLGPGSKETPWTCVGSPC